MEASKEGIEMSDQWKLVPVEPTQEMMDAGLYQSSHDSTSADVHSIWKDMVAFAPTQGADVRPFANCRYRICDLPGQCRDEGHCHHPASGERGADARPVAIYQIRASRFVSDWTDVSSLDPRFHDYPKELRRIVYATCDAAPIDSPEFREAVTSLVSDMLTAWIADLPISACGEISARANALLQGRGAVAPREKT
jgi:hypothetical protein